MSIVIYTYHDPYKIDQEPYWDEIKNCPYFCSAQTLVNGLRSHYKEKFDGGRVSTVKILTDSLYVDWASPAWIVKQHTDIDNIINSGFSTDLSESERINIGRAFLFNRDDVFASIRTMFELNVDPSAILKNKLTKEQRFILGIYQKILASEMKKDFYLARSLAEEEIDEGLRRAMTAIQEDYNFSDVNLDTIVIHGVHQFNPIMLRAIDELQKYKNVILLFNYQKQYKNVYQTWFDIYSAFDCKIIDCDRNEFLATDSSTVSYKGNVLADQLGKLVNGQRRAITVGDPYEIIEFDNMTEFAGYVADIFEEAERKDPQKPMHHMREQIYAANSSANDILKIYFPEQFGERQFLNYPIGHFFLAIANMWDPEKNEILISDINDVRECLGANILSEDVPGQLVSIFGKIQALFDGCVSIKQMRKRLKSLKKNMKYITDSLEQEYVSHMCTYADDLKFAFQRISKRVMTTEKIIGRWDSMFNNKLSIRDGAIIHINTAIKPNYHTKDEWDDRPVSDADMNWNIYVLLLLRRYGLIEIIDITNDNGIYIFSISIENVLLLNKGDEQTLLIEEIRSLEWAYYNNAYLTMERAITRSERECWSEMFFDTYDKVYEYCAGCNAHLRKNSGDTFAFPLKKSIKAPISVVEMDQKKIFESQDELIVLAGSEEKKKVIKFLESQRLSTLVASNSQLQEIDFYGSISDGKTLFVVNAGDLKELLKKGNYYFVSGMVAILYPDDENEVFEIYKLVTKYLQHKLGIHIVHILSENFFLPVIGKSIADVIEGRVVLANDICAEMR